MAAVSQDAQTVNMAETTLIPAWNARLQTLLGAPTHILIDFNVLTQHVADPVAKNKIISAVVLPSSKTMGITTSQPAVETLVRAFEHVAQDAGVKADIAAGVKQIQFFSLPPGSIPDNKSLVLDAGVLKYTGAFSEGSKGLFTKQKIIDFLELHFFAQERVLVSRFLNSPEGMPKHLQRLANALPQGPTLNFDVVGAIGQASAPEKRLSIARTIVSRDGVSRDVDFAARKAQTGLIKVGSEIEAQVLGQQPQQPIPANPEKDVYNSPNVVAPLVAALEYVAGQSPDIPQLISSSIREIRIICLPGATPPTQKSLVLLGEKGQVIEPSSAPVPPVIKGAILQYSGCFEAPGSKGCFSKDDFVDFFERHFRCQERGFVGRMMSEAIPALNQRLDVAVAPGVQIEFMWNDIFPADLAPGYDRVNVAKTLCQGGSKLTVQPFVKALEEIVNAAGAPGPSNPVHTHLKGQVTRIIIQPLASAVKPAVNLSTGPAGSVLVYSPNLRKGARGVFDVQEAKDNIRGLLGIEKPASEKGANAILNKGVTELNRLGDDVGKALGKMSFFKSFK